MKTIIFFNNKGGVGKTTLAYHVGYMLAELRKNVLMLDLDPQMNLTSMMLTDERLSEIYEEEIPQLTIISSIRPVIKGIGDIKPAHLEHITERLFLIPGDLELSAFEDRLSDNWTKCLDGDELAFRTISVFHRIIKEAAGRTQADYCLIDVGPNFGAINRATLIAADDVIIPMVADLFSLMGLRNVGETLEKWRKEWVERLKKNPEPNLSLPNALMQPMGYIVIQHGVKENHPVKAYLKWANRIPLYFQEYVLNRYNFVNIDTTIENDSDCLAVLKHYRSLMPMAMETHKPIFFLKPADGAIGAHFQAVKEVYKDFKALCERIIAKT